MELNEFQYYHLSGTQAGTVLISDHSGALGNVILPANKTGTVDFYDSDTLAGTSSSNLIFSVPQTSGTIASNMMCGFRLRKGLVAVSGGTTDMTIVYK